MNRRVKLLLGFGVAALLARPGFAQDGGKDPGAPATAPEAPTAAAGEAPAGESPKDAQTAKHGGKYDVFVEFDKDDAQGQILCKNGRVKGDSVEYERCAKGKMDKYDKVAVKRGIVASDEDFSKLDPKQKNLAKKLAFYDSASETVKKKMAAEAADKKESGLEYKKLKGALGKIDKDLAKAVAECAKSGGALKCPPAEESKDPKAPGN